MSAVLLGQHKTGSDEWHQLRSQGIGGSEIASVVGLSPWMSAFELWHRKKGNLPGIRTNEQMEWGAKLEPLVAAHFEEQHPEYHVSQSGTYAHLDRSWQIANVDRTVYSSGEIADGWPLFVSLLEVKTSRFPDDWGQSGSDKIPIQYRCQVMWYMDVLGVEVAWVAVLIGGSEYREYIIDYDESDAIALREAGERFWLSLQADDEPPLDASESTYNAVRELHPDIDGTDVEINGVLYDHYHNTKTAAERAAAEARQAKSQVLDAMGSARRATVGEQPVLRRQPNKSGVSLYDIGETA